MDKKYTVYINNLGYMRSPFVLDAEIALEITEEEYNKTRSFKSETAWKWNYELNTFELVATPNHVALRLAREVECFKFVNRGPLWYSTLSEDQQEELSSWYRAWLDVTETGQVPTKPEWLK